MSDCSPEMMREHERRIAEATQSSAQAHHRINEVVALVRDFTIEMRESNKNISELVSEVKLLTQEIGHIATTTEKHGEEIADIKDNMETKDTVLSLYGKIEESNTKHEKGMDAIMDKLRQQEKALEDHKLEPARQALADQQALKKWLIVGFGSILLTVATAAVLMFLNMK